MEKNMDENRMTEMFEKNCDLFSAVESVGNKAVDDLGYNQSYTFAPGLTATYELYTYGPKVPYHGQYAYLNEEKLGEQINPEPSLSGEDWFWAKQRLFHRIVVKAADVPVYIIQGMNVFQCSLYEGGSWEDELLSWFQANGRY